MVDIDQEAGIARGNTWMSLFSPQNRDYNMHAIPTPLDAKDPPACRDGSGGEPARPPAGTEVVMSWFSVPEDQFGAMGSSSRRFSFSGSGYAYQPVGGVESLENVRIPIWSTKCITAQWFGPAAPLVESDLQQTGTDRLAGTVTNRQSVRARRRVARLRQAGLSCWATRARGVASRRAGADHRNLSGHLKSKAQKYISDQPWNRDNFKIDRSELMQAVMFHDSEINAAERTRPGQRPASSTSTSSGQLALQRPMLVARIDRTGARLVLDKIPVAAQDRSIDARPTHSAAQEISEGAPR